MANSAEEVRCQFIPWNLCFSYPRSSKVLSSSVLRSDASQKADWLRQIKRAIEDKRKADAASGVLPPVMMLQFISACCYSSLAARAQVKVRRETEQKVTAVCAFEFIGPTIKLHQCKTKSLNHNCFYRESKKRPEVCPLFSSPSAACGMASILLCILAVAILYFSFLYMRQWWQTLDGMPGRDLFYLLFFLSLFFMRITYFRVICLIFQ